MDSRKNFFFYFSLIIFEVFVICALFCWFIYNCEPPNISLSCLPWVLFPAAIFGLVHLGSFTACRLPYADRICNFKEQRGKTQRGFVIAVFIIAAALRIWAIESVTVSPYSDFKTYYEIAAMLVKGPLSQSGYSSYVASFPHVYGYPFVLSLLFRLTGPSLRAGLYLNMFFSLLSVFLTYKVSKMLGGWTAGLTALFLAAFWPSQILFGTVLSSEPLFTLLLLFCFWLFLLIARLPQTAGNSDVSAFLCTLLGLFLALSSAVRPLGLIMLIAVLLYLLPCRTAFDENEKLLLSPGVRAACQGWFRGLIVFTVYIAVSAFISSSISHNTGMKLPGAGHSFGFNLMVGLNSGSLGAWNEDDAEFFSLVLSRTNSASAAHRACIDVALERFSENHSGIARLFMRKFYSLWSNDDYAVSWVWFFLNRQGTITPPLTQGLYRIRVLGSLFYSTAVLFSGAYGFMAHRHKKNRPSFVLMLLFIGTALLHLILETQNRYHYYIIPVFIILGSLGVSGIYGLYSSKREKKKGK